MRSLFVLKSLGLQPIIFITYVALGKKYQYFDFFTVGNGNEAIPPVWGVATVVESRNDTIVQGERIYGYFPMAKYYHMIPVNTKPAHFYVSRPHLPLDRAVYNQYFRATGDPDYSVEQEDQMMIFRPLWGTSFFLDDYLQSENYFASDTIVVSSASSKTAYCFALLQKGKGKRVIGLTSGSNVFFVTGLGLYDKVVEYTHLEQLPKTEKILYIDVAGDSDLDNKIFEMIGKQIVKRVSVGMSHFDGKSPTFGSEVRSKSVNFFAPDWIKKRFQAYKGDIVERRTKAWKDLLKFSNNCVHLEAVIGSTGIKKVYLEMLHGKAKPETGYVLSFFGGNSKL